MTIHCWNVRGLDKSSKWKLVKLSILESQCDIICLQETKVRLLDEKLLKSSCGKNFNCWDAKAVDGSWGGNYLLERLPLLWFPIPPRMLHLDYMLSSPKKQQLSAFTITNIYGPCTHQDLKQFFKELSFTKNDCHSLDNSRGFQCNTMPWRPTYTNFS